MLWSQRDILCQSQDRSQDARRFYSDIFSLLEFEVLSLIDDGLNVYAFEERIVKQGRKIGACWSCVWEVLEKKLLKLFVCHLFDGLW